MPRFDSALIAQAQSALGLTRAGELVHSAGGVIGRREWTITRLEALYELAYLRVFAAWEICLEAVFYRSLCGYASRAGQETLIGGGHFRNIAAAEAAALAGQQFLLWHDPGRVMRRCQRFIASGTGYPALQETMVASNQSRLSEFAAIRHRIAHDQTDAKRKFDAATLSIAGRTYLASRPGRFLRDWHPTSSPKARWLEAIIQEFGLLASQIV